VARNVLLILGSGLGSNLGPNFNLTSDAGAVTPSTATRTQLLAGLIVSVNDATTSVTVTSTGVCANSITQSLPCPPLTTSTTTSTSTTSTTSTSTTSTSTSTTSTTSTSTTTTAPPFSTSTTTTTIAAISCGTSSTFTGGESYPTQQFVTLGSDTGTVVLNYNGQSVPDRFIVEWNGSVVIDTGYAGSSLYDFGGSIRNTFKLYLSDKLDPITGNSYPDFATYPDDGYPRVGPSTGTSSFSKNLTSPTVATVKTYAPGGGTGWSYTLNCPI
jgi:hypothetical protein